ncbi:uncharacterized protein BKA78DRAFT_76560 [Phyllosticta capitalensis]|uniref:uncharacterized protein n=1 Tax=Phyllosticta capitalensis TaxID=121624 RepID=UPI00313065F1
MMDLDFATPNTCTFVCAVPWFQITWFQIFFKKKRLSYAILVGRRLAWQSVVACSRGWKRLAIYGRLEKTTETPSTRSASRLSGIRGRWRGHVFKERNERSPNGPRSQSLESTADDAKGRGQTRPKPSTLTCNRYSLACPHVDDTCRTYGAIQSREAFVALNNYVDSTPLLLTTMSLLPLY